MNALLTTKNDHERIPNGERPLTFLFLRRSGGNKIFANCDDLGDLLHKNLKPSCLHNTKNQADFTELPEFSR